MFDKLKFNNLVISNKSQIQQARIQTINKLVHKIKNIKTSLEKCPENTKHKERIRRTAETIAELKKFKRFEIMRSVLLLEKNPNAVITNGYATPNDLAIAQMALNNIMKKLIHNFRDALKLTESDVSWREVIVQSSKRRSKIERTERKRRERKELKEQKVMSRKRNEWLQENFVESKIELLNDGAENTNMSDWKVEVMDASKNNIENTTKLQSEGPAKLLIKKEKIVKQKVKTKSEQKQENIVKDDELLNNITTYETCNKNNEEKPEFVVDSFFITESGDHYLSSAIDQIGEHEEIDENFDTYTNRRVDRRENKLDKRKSERFGKRESNRATYISDRHPSWLAKQKTKPIISKFTGKKVIFDNEGTSVDNVSKLKSTQTNDSLSKETITDMHPSWVAKQKLKPKIAEFKGKKITFDNEDDCV